MEAATDNSNLRKTRRISRACDYCHHRSIRCRASSAGSNGRCQNCVDFEQPCTYDRPAKRRGAKARGQSVSTLAHDGDLKSEDTSPGSWATNNISRQFTLTSPLEARSTSDLLNGISPSQWRPPNIATQSIVVDLVDIYFEVIYPIFPFFHRPTFVRQVSHGEYRTNRYLFAATMAVCALASARARDGSLFSTRWNPEQLKEPPSEAFYAAAQDAIPFDLVTAGDHNCMRACALLAITNVQWGQLRIMHQNLARYLSLVAMDGLHNEANWPKDIGIVETEERRRLFWSMYMFDVYSAVVWSGVIRHREAQSEVKYPTELDDDDFDDTGYDDSATINGPSPSNNMRSTQLTSWLSGWNFTTDLYRILEHAMENFQTRRGELQRKTFLKEIFGEKAPITQVSVCDSVMHMYTDLPQHFKRTEPITFDPKVDRYGFQAANIAATVQLLRMVLFAARGATVSEKCQIASEVVEAFITIPVGYLRAISSPLLHHLAGIGSILGSVFEEPMSELEYLQVRSILLAMAQLLANLDIGLQSTAGASERLRLHVARIDDYMAVRRVSFNRALPQTQSSLSIRNGTNHISPDLDTVKLELQSPNKPNGSVDDAMSQFQLPADILEEWPWVFDFAQTSLGGPWL